MDRIKPYLEAAEKHIRNKQFKEALSEAETALLFMGTNLQANLYAGRCCIELKEYDKAEEYVKQALQAQPESLECLKSLCILYKQQEKWVEYYDTLRKIADILKKKKMFPQYYEQAIKLYEYYVEQEKYPKVAEVYQELTECEGIEDEKKKSLNMKFFKDAFGKIDYSNPLSETMLANALTSSASFEDSEDIIEKSIGYLQYKFIKNGKFQEFYSQLLKLDKENPKSLILLKHKIEYSPIILDNKDNFIHLYEEVVAFMLFNSVFPNVPNDLLEEAQKLKKWEPYLKYQDLSNKNKPLFDQISPYAITFQKFSEIANLPKLILDSSVTQILGKIPKTSLETCLQAASTLKYIFIYPILIAHGLSTGDKAQANASLNEFGQQIQKERCLYNLNTLEEIHANFGLEIGLNPEELVASANKVKDLLKKEPDNLENLKLFYNYQIRIIKQLQRVDEDLNLFNIVSNVLDYEPENSFYLSEKAWLILSNQNLSDQFKEIDVLLRKAITHSQSLDNAQQAQIYLRLATLNLLKDPNNQDSLQKARDLYLHAWELDPNESKCFKAQAVLYANYDNDNLKALNCLTKSIDVTKPDEDFFKLQFYLLMKCNAKDKALNFLKGIYKFIKNSFWINYTLGMLLLEVQDYNRSLHLITRACELYEYYKKDQPYLGYKSFDTFGVRYLAQTHGIAYAEDIPFLSDAFYEKNNAPTLSNSFFLTQNPKIEFNLYYTYCQLHKSLGRIGSAFKTLEKLSECLEMTTKVTYQDKTPGDATKCQNLELARSLIQDQFLIRGRSAAPSEEQVLSYDFEKFGSEILLYYITKATLSFYLSNFNESFTSIIEAIKYFEILHKCKLSNFDYKRAALLERELVAITSEVMAKYVQNTFAKEIVDIALYRLETALKIVDCFQSIIQQEISISNIYLNRSLSDIYLFKGLHGCCDQSLETAEKYLKNILRLCFANYDAIESGAEDGGEISDKMETEGMCPKNQEIIYDCLFNIALINLNMTKRKPEIPTYLEKARNLSKFGIRSFEDCSQFWLLYAFTQETEKKKKAALLAGISNDPQNTEVVNALSYCFIKEKKVTFATKLLLKSLELDALENYKAFNGLSLVNIVVGLELLARKNGTIEKNPEFLKELYENSKIFIEKSYFYSLNSQEITQTALAEKFQAIFFYLCGDFSKSADHFENYFRYQRQNIEQSNTKDPVFWQYYVISLVKSGRKGLFIPTITNDSFITPDILALIDNKTPANHKYNDQFYTEFTQSLAQNSKHDTLANLLLDDLDKRWEEWSAQSAEWLANSQLSLFKAFHKFLEILRRIHMVGSLYLLDKQYEDCYAFIVDYLKELPNLGNLATLEQHHSEFSNLTNEYQKILGLYLNCLILILKTNKTKDHTQIQNDLELVIEALCESSDGDDGDKKKIRKPFNLVFNKSDSDLHPKRSANAQLLHGIAKILAGDLPQAKIALFTALKDDCDNHLVKKILSLYYVLYERKKSVIPDYNLAVFDEYKARRDYDLDSTSNINKTRPFHLNLIGEDTNCYALLEYLEAYHKCQNPQQRKSLIARAAMYLNDINVWFIFCAEFLQHAHERTPQRLCYLLSVLYNKVIREIANTKSLTRRDTYDKVLKKAVKLACEIKILFETSSFAEKEQFNAEFNSVFDQITTTSNGIVGQEKLQNYSKKLQIFYDSDKLLANKPENFANLFTKDIHSLFFAKEICVKLYENNWTGNLENLFQDLRNQFLKSLEAAQNDTNLTKKDRLRLEEGLLQVELILYTIHLRQTVLTEGKPEEHVNALEKLGTAFEWCQKHLNKNKQIYTLLINYHHQIGDFDSVEAYLTTLNYLECPENMSRIGNLYCLLIFYNKLQSEFTSAEDKEQLHENINMIAEEILSNSTEKSHVVGITYYVQGLCELLKASDKTQIIDSKKVKSIFAKAALFVPAQARTILKNFV